MQRVSSSRVRVSAVIGLLAITLMAAGAGIVEAVSSGTAGELNYQKKTFAVTGTDPGGPTFSNRKVACIDGRHVTGGGSEGDGQFASADGGRPYDGADAGAIPDDGWMVTASIFGERTGSITVYAICDN